MLKTMVGTSLLMGVVVAAAGGRANAQEPAPAAAGALHSVDVSSGIEEAVPEMPGTAESVLPDGAPGQQPPGDGSTAAGPPHELAVSDDVVARAAASVAGDPGAPPEGDRSSGGGVAWRSLLRQSVAMLVVQHTWRATFEDGTWAETKRGIFWDDYFASARSICCWNDGDKFTTNNLFHPMLGSTSAFVFANNHEPSQRTPLGNTRRYWSNKAKAMAYAAVYSAYFELGPVLSEAAIGNVGLTPGQQTWHDIVITPTVGIALSVGEDLLRVHVIDKVDRRSHALGIPLALLLNPTRSVANVFAGKVPWSAPAALSRRSTADRR